MPMLYGEVGELKKKPWMRETWGRFREDCMKIMVTNGLVSCLTEDFIVVRTREACSPRKNCLEAFYA